MQNIFELARDVSNPIGRIFKRATWSHPRTYVILTRIEPKKTPNGLFGRAWGRHFYQGVEQPEQQISCAGNYSWMILPEGSSPGELNQAICWKCNKPIGGPGAAGCKVRHAADPEVAEPTSPAQDKVRPKKTVKFRGRRFENRGKFDARKRSE